MDKIKEPTANDDCRELWQIVLECVRRINALGDCDINTADRQNKLILTPSKATLSLQLGGLTPQLLAACSNNVKGYRYVLASDFIAASGS